MITLASTIQPRRRGENRSLIVFAPGLARASSRTGRCHSPEGGGKSQNIRQPAGKREEVSYSQQLQSRNISYFFNTSVFGIFYFTAMLIACFGPRLIKRGCNRIPMIAVGLALFSVSLLSMGLIGSVSSDWLFLALAHLSRLVQGIG